VTITFKRTGFKNIGECRKLAIHLSKGHIEDTEPECFIITHELHEDGWSHVHGIVAYDKDLDSKDCLKTKSRTIGIVSVYPLRDTPYKQVKPGPFGIININWENHFEYIIKDQLLNNKKLKDLNYIYIKHEKPNPRNNKQLNNKIIKDLIEDLKYHKTIENNLINKQLKTQVNGKIVNFDK